jgi:hypothetical protein
MLSLSLFMGGGVAGAAPDSDSGGSTGQSQGADGADGTKPAATTPRGPLRTIADNLRKQIEDSLRSTVQGVTGSLNALPSPSQIQAALPKSPKTTFGGTPTVHGVSESGSADAKIATPSTDATPAAVEAPVDPPASEQSVTPPPATAPTVPAAKPPPDPAKIVNGVVVPVTNLVTTVTNTVASIPGAIATFPGSLPQVTDVITSVQNMLTSVAAVSNSLTQLPSDLAGLLGVDTTIPTGTVGASTGHTVLPTIGHVPTPPQATTSLPQLLMPTQVQTRLPVVAPATAPVTPLDVMTARASGAAATSGRTEVAPNIATSKDVLSTVEHVIGAVVATVSLTALAAVALPGLAGLLTTCAAGIRIGYRQAKAGTGLPATVISRFVGSGPVGVVRSSSQVELRSRASRMVQPSAPVAERTRALRLVRAESATADLLDRAG